MNIVDYSLLFFENVYAIIQIKTNYMIRYSENIEEAASNLVLNLWIV